MVGACQRQLPDKYVSRANLLLGISQLKLGDRESARRAFINATLIGGASKQAGDWLEFMGAEPPTDRETRRIVGVCYGSRDKRVSAADIADAAGQDSAVAAEQAETVAVRTVPRQNLFYIEYDKPLTELAGEVESLAMRMSVALIKSGGKVDGPLQLISIGMPGENPLQLAFPTGGSPRAGKQYKVRQTGAFKCAYLVHQGEMESLGDLWRDFVATVTEAGYQLTGESRTVFVGRGGGVELQLGIE